jgi:hypothetical protein
MIRRCECFCEPQPLNDSFNMGQQRAEKYQK